MKILTLALNEAAIEGEWQAAAVRLISGLRKEHVKPEMFSTLYRPPAKTGRQRGAYVMPFGQHKGSLITQIPDGYLIWMFETMELREPLKSALNAELERRGL